MTQAQGFPNGMNESLWIVDSPNMVIEVIADTREAAYEQGLSILIDQIGEDEAMREHAAGQIIVYATEPK